MSWLEPLVFTQVLTACAVLGADLVSRVPEHGATAHTVCTAYGASVHTRYTVCRQSFSAVQHGRNSFHIVPGPH